MDEAEKIQRRALSILINFTRSTGHQHPLLQAIVDDYAGLLQQMGYDREQIMTKLRELAPDMFGG